MAAAPGSVLSAHPWVSRRPITVGEYHRMIEAGILTENDRIELIEGDLVSMHPIGGPHASTVMKLTRALFRIVGDGALVWSQNPVQLGDRSEPEPDVSLLKPRADDYAEIPRADDVLLIIEVSDSTLRYDREVKRPLYARNGISETWIVNLIDREVEVARGPTPDGYVSVMKVGPEEVLDIAALPGMLLPIREFIR